MSKSQKKSAEQQQVRIRVAANVAKKLQVTAANKKMSLSEAISFFLEKGVNNPTTLAAIRLRKLNKPLGC